MPTGGRLGYGGGFYDRTLAGLPGRFRLGCAFAAQQVDAVPVGPYDITAGCRGDRERHHPLRGLM